MSDDQSQLPNLGSRFNQSAWEAVRGRRMVRERIRFAVTCTSRAVGETKGLWSRKDHLFCPTRRLTQINGARPLSCHRHQVRSGARQPPRRHRRGLICRSESRADGSPICPQSDFFLSIEAASQGPCSRRIAPSHLVLAHGALADDVGGEGSRRAAGGGHYSGTRPCAGLQNGLKLGQKRRMSLGAVQRVRAREMVKAGLSASRP